MGRILLVLALVGSLISPAASRAAFLEEGRAQAEGCQAVNPGQPTCSYEVTHETESPVTGVAGIGDWVVKIKRGKKTITVKSPGPGEPTAQEVAFETGDKVKAKALTPASAVTVGHVD